MTSPSAPVDLSPAAPPGVRAPDRALLWLEQRAFFELGALAAAAPWLRLLGRGDHHPVLVLPGFTASDLSTTPLRWHLRSWGYWAHGWHLGRNLGPTPGVLNGLVQRLDTVHRRHGRKVSLVGWSLGGIYARELARQFPDHVRSVITLGSPYRMSLGDRSSVSRLLDVVGGTFAPEIIDLWVQESERTPLAMPATSIYTRTDGIVRWHTCIDTEGHKKENIEVLGSHSGLGFNPAVLYAVANRLAQPEDDWRPFAPPALLHRFYPKPVTWSDDSSIQERALRVARRADAAS